VDCFRDGANSRLRERVRRKRQCKPLSRCRENALQRQRGRQSLVRRLLERRLGLGIDEARLPSRMMRDSKEYDSFEGRCQVQLNCINPSLFCLASVTAFRRFPEPSAFSSSQRSPA
jgi:hypothetical protein